MAVNRHRPHLVVLSEDDAIRSLAVGFSDYANGPMEIRKPAGGWPGVLHEFLSTYVGHLKNYKDAYVLMVIDFDDQFDSRIVHFQSKIPGEFAERVFVLGAKTEAETLKRDLGMPLGSLGGKLAEECREQHPVHWMCPQLQHNQPEVARLNATVRPFLF